MVRRTSASQRCPCGGPDYAACCGRYLDGSEPAPTAEALMRSRYTAYSRDCIAYLRATWHPSTQPVDELTPQPGLQWLGLEVRTHQPDGDTATVEFVARYKIAGRAHRLHEMSRFVREEGRWWYVDGSFPGERE